MPLTICSAEPGPSLRIRSSRRTSGRGRCSGASAPIVRRAIATLRCCDDPIAPGSAPVALYGASAALCDPIIPELLDVCTDAHAGHSAIERKGNLGRRGVPIASQLRSASDLHRARLRSVASANASSLEELDELYSVGNGAAVGEMIAQFGSDRRRPSINADKLKLGLCSAW